MIIGQDVLGLRRKQHPTSRLDVAPKNRAGQSGTPLMDKK